MPEPTIAEVMTAAGQGFALSCKGKRGQDDGGHAPDCPGRPYLKGVCNCHLSQPPSPAGGEVEEDVRILRNALEAFGNSPALSALARLETELEIERTRADCHELTVNEGMEVNMDLEGQVETLKAELAALKEKESATWSRMVADACSLEAASVAEGIVELSLQTAGDGLVHMSPGALHDIARQVQLLGAAQTVAATPSAREEAEATPAPASGDLEELAKEIDAIRERMMAWAELPTDRRHGIRHVWDWSKELGVISGALRCQPTPRVEELETERARNASLSKLLADGFMEEVSETLKGVTPFSKARVEELECRIDALERSDMEYRTELGELRPKAAASQSRVAELEGEVEKARRTAEHWKAEHLAGNEALTASQARVKELEAEVERLRETLAAQSVHIDSLAAHNTALWADGEQLRSSSKEAALLKHQVARLRWAIKGGTAIKDTPALIRHMAAELKNRHGVSPETDWLRSAEERAAMLENARKAATPPTPPGGEDDPPATPPPLTEEELDAVSASLGPMRLLAQECNGIGNTVGEKKVREQIATIEALVSRHQAGKGGE